MRLIEKSTVQKKLNELQKEYPYNGTEREKAIYDVCAHIGAFVELLPDISPDSLVKRGRWEEHPSGDPMCSECKELLTTEQDLHGGNKFCPYCGAMMDESGDQMED